MKEFEILPRELKVLSTTQGFISAERLFSPRRVGAEAYLTAFSVFYKDSNSGSLQTRLIAQKSIVSLGNPEAKAQARVQRLKFLQNQGVRTVEIFGLDGADIFEEYIPDAKKAQEGIAVIKSDRQPQQLRMDLLAQLVQVAAVLDKNGFKILGNFYSDLIFDGKTFYFVDGGWDLGDPNPQISSQECKVRLLDEFKNSGLSESIEQMYSQAPVVA